MSGVPVATMPGSGVPVFNWPRPATQSPAADATQAGYDYDAIGEPDAVKYRNLPQRPEDMRGLVRERFDAQIASVQEPDIRLDLIRGRSKLITTKQPVVRVSIAEPGIVETVNFSPNEFELIGRTIGETTVTLWFGDAQPSDGKTPLHPNIR
ncbi:MAG: pilus assembly protein N-terminal domain-containing protein, partial [Planctomycetes bacterium]|nr:pilus assembly protein N-terminal domain-containing protein [Planctomycetota bacterium]